MKNYEKVVKHQKKIRKENEEKAITAINRLYDNKKSVTVKELVEMTGLSRSYFYKNEKVNKILRKVLLLQKGDNELLQKNVIFNLAAANSNELLIRQMSILEKKYYTLQNENKKLKEKIKHTEDKIKYGELI